jgi:short-subunit dehydrogenase
MVARRRQRLEALARELTDSFGVQCWPIVFDLSQPGCGASLLAEVQKLGLEVDLLVNNAGFGVLGKVECVDPAKSLAMVDLNCRAVVDVTASFMPPMKARKRGGVIIVSSVVGAIPAPFFATYAATKAFDLYFGEALYGECRGSGVNVITVLPGLTRTEFQAGAGMRDYHSPYRSADQVVQSTMNALGRKAIVVDGWMNKFLVHCTRLLPRSIVLAISRAVMRKEVAPELL